MSNNPQGAGVLGENTGGGAGVSGIGGSNGVIGESQNGEGIRGLSHNPNHGGVVGVNDGGGDAVLGTATSGRGVVGHSSSQAGVAGDSDTFDGVFGVSRNPAAAGVSGHSLNANGSVNKTGLAGFFDGKIMVTGDSRIAGTLIVETAAYIAGINANPINNGMPVFVDSEGKLGTSPDPFENLVQKIIQAEGIEQRMALMEERIAVLEAELKQR
jgi:hypothetical protein